MAQRPLCSGPQLIADEERAGECRGAVREMVVALWWWCKWRCRAAGGSAAAAAQQRPVAQRSAFSSPTTVSTRQFCHKISDIMNLLALRPT